MIVMGVAILGLVLLFFIKNWEEKHARIFIPGLRLAADDRALELKALLVWCESEFRKLGPTSIRVSRALLHDLALSLAALSRASERGAHRLADMLSHKHRFERKETKNEFLKQVGEIPIRNLRDTPLMPLAPILERPVGGETPPLAPSHSAREVPLVVGTPMQDPVGINANGSTVKKSRGRKKQ